MTTVRGLGGYGSAHPAGIFSDLSVDGPVIGTLVVILDRGVGSQDVEHPRSMYLLTSV